MATVGPRLAEVAQLVGDPGRANILFSLMNSETLSAGELARVAGVSAQTASSHLAKMLERGLLTMERRGRQRFYRLATPLVGQMLESILSVSALGPQRYQPVTRK
jgi:DNA-binding transcriptional ArsR family regulator